MCDAGHQPVSTSICATGCAASQKINGFYVCCVGNCRTCGGTVSSDRGYNAATGATTTEYTGGATSSYYTQTDTDGDGVNETTYISEDRWDLWAEQLQGQAALAIVGIPDASTNRFWKILEWDASANGLFSHLYNEEWSVLPDGTQGAGTAVSGTSDQGEIIKISRFAKDYACSNGAYVSDNYGEDDQTENDDAGCELDLKNIVEVRNRLGGYYMSQAPADDYNNKNWKLAARQYDLIVKLIEFVNENHSYTSETSPFTGKRKLSGFSKNSQLRKKVADSRIKKETKTISDAFLSAWEAFKNEIKAN